MTAYNLTVDGLHTYYAGENSVLVHNTSCDPDLDSLSQSGMRSVKGDTTHAGRECQKRMDRGDLPVVRGKQLKSAGQGLLDEILTNPKTERFPVDSGAFAGGSRYIMPNSSGVEGPGQRSMSTVLFGTLGGISGVGNQALGCSRWRRFWDR